MIKGMQQVREGDDVKCVDWAVIVSFSLLTHFS